MEPSDARRMWASYCQILAMWDLPTPSTKSPSLEDFELPENMVEIIDEMTVKWNIPDVLNGETPREFQLPDAVVAEANRERAQVSRNYASAWLAPLPHTTPSYTSGQPSAAPTVPVKSSPLSSKPPTGPDREQRSEGPSVLGRGPPQASPVAERSVGASVEPEASTLAPQRGSQVKGAASTSGEPSVGLANAPSEDYTQQSIESAAQSSSVSASGGVGTGQSQGCTLGVSSPRTPQAPPAELQQQSPVWNLAGQMAPPVAAPDRVPPDGSAPDRAVGALRPSWGPETAAAGGAKYGPGCDPTIRGVRQPVGWLPQTTSAPFTQSIGAFYQQPPQPGPGAATSYAQRVHLASYAPHQVGSTQQTNGTHMATPAAEQMHTYMPYPHQAGYWGVPPWPAASHQLTRYAIYERLTRSLHYQQNAGFYGYPPRFRCPQPTEFAPRTSGNQSLSPFCDPDAFRGANGTPRPTENLRLFRFSEPSPFHTARPTEVSATRVDNVVNTTTQLNSNVSVNKRKKRRSGQGNAKGKSAEQTQPCQDGKLQQHFEADHQGSGGRQEKQNPKHGTQWKPPVKTYLGKRDRAGRSSGLDGTLPKETSYANMSPAVTQSPQSQPGGNRGQHWHNPLQEQPHETQETYSGHQPGPAESAAQRDVAEGRIDQGQSSAGNQQGPALEMQSNDERGDGASYIRGQNRDMSKGRDLSEERRAMPENSTHAGQQPPDNLPDDVAKTQRSPNSSQLQLKQRQREQSTDRSAPATAKNQRSPIPKITITAIGPGLHAVVSTSSSRCAGKENVPVSPVRPRESVQCSPQAAHGGQRDGRSSRDLAGMRTDEFRMRSGVITASTPEAAMSGNETVTPSTDSAHGVDGEGRGEDEDPLSLSPGAVLMPEDPFGVPKNVLPILENPSMSSESFRVSRDPPPIPEDPLALPEDPLAVSDNLNSKSGNASIGNRAGLKEYSTSSKVTNSERISVPLESGCGLKRIQQRKDMKQNFPFWCKTCHEVFRSDKSCRFHEELHHTHKKNRTIFKCETCDRIFQSPAKFEQHKQLHLVPGRSAEMRCYVCGDSQNSRNALLSHQRAHNDSLPLVCVVCGAKFLVKLRLDAHQMVKHWPFVCQVCGKPYRSEMRFNTHVNKHYQAGGAQQEASVSNTGPENAASSSRIGAVQQEDSSTPEEGRSSGGSEEQASRKSNGGMNSKLDQKLTFMISDYPVESQAWHDRFVPQEVPLSEAEEQMATQEHILPTEKHVPFTLEHTMPTLEQLEASASSYDGEYANVEMESPGPDLVILEVEGGVTNVEHQGDSDAILRDIHLETVQG